MKAKPYSRAKIDFSICWVERHKSRVSRPLALVVAALLLLVPYSLGTSALVIKPLPGDVIYVAADSLVADSKSGFTMHFCKINKLGSMYWVAATRFYSHPSTGFDLKALVSSIGTDGTLVERMERFIKIAEPAMESEIASIETEAPAEYARYVAGELTPLQISFITVENGRPVFVSTDFAISKVKGQVVAKATYPIKPAPVTRKYPISLKPLGDSALAIDYLKTHQFQLIDAPHATIEHALSLEETAHPEEVGQPFSLLRLGAKGPEWMDRGECK
jgi:hypothetical protein